MQHRWKERRNGELDALDAGFMPAARAFSLPGQSLQCKLIGRKEPLQAGRALLR